ncbi:MAG: Lrp/AsnC family transcriptional regulator [Nanoarchaeota archaeon]
MDSKDEKILELLKRDSKLAVWQIAKKACMPVTTAHNRIKKMEKEGVIKGYTLSLDYAKLGKPITSFILVNIAYMLPSGKKIRQEDAAKEIKKQPGVEEVCIMTGTADILVKLRVHDINDLNDFVVNKLRSIDGISNTQTMIVLSSY